MAEVTPQITIERENHSSTSVLTANRAKAPRSACDYCHQSKVRCTGGGSACGRCKRDNISCHYSYPARLGKPKGCKNKKTIEKLNALAQLAKQPCTTEESTWENTRSSNIDSTCIANTRSEHSTKDSIIETSENDGAPTTVSDSVEGAQLGGDSGNGFDTSIFTDFSDTVDSSGLSSLGPLQGLADAFGDLVSFSPLQSTDSFFALPPGATDVEDYYDDLNFTHLNDLDIPASPSPMHSPSRALFTSPEHSEWLFNTLQDSIIADKSTLKGCDCLQKQAKHLCELRLVEQRHNQPRQEDVMHLSSTIFKSMEMCLDCKICTGDLQVTHLMGMVLRALLTSINATCRGGGDINIQLGNYNMDREDCAWLNTLILSRLLAKFKGLIEQFRKRAADSKRGIQRLDSEFLEQVAKELFASLNKCARHVCKQRASFGIDIG